PAVRAIARMPYKQECLIRRMTFDGGTMNQQEKELDAKAEKRDKSMKLFTLLLAGQLISSIGSGLTDFGLAIYVLALTGSVTAASVVSICAFLPSILLAPAGGVLADHYDRRMMMVFGELLSGLGLVICLVTIMSGTPSLVFICIGVAVSSIFTALMEPAFKATITDLLTEEDFAKAGGWFRLLIVQSYWSHRLLRGSCCWLRRSVP
ncbi:MAG: MFS transporter, partial [Gorillibacterium sp.]|nr:MFS transporter [Gorillibacterium sp.]